MIRQATIDDVEVLLQRGELFHKAARLPFSFDKNKTRTFVENLLVNGIIFISEKGMVGGVLTTPFSSDDWLVAVEMFWWSRGDGVELLAEFEKWAIENRADEIRMTSFEHLKIASSILGVSGYNRTEVSYSKVIKWPS